MTTTAQADVPAVAHLTTEGWPQLRAALKPRSWGTLGVLQFPAAPTQVRQILAGAMGSGADLSVLDLWVPAVRGAWVPLQELGEAARDVALRGAVAVFGRNRGDVELEVDLRFQLHDEPAPPPVDPTPAYYASLVWRETYYRGVQTLKHPCDLWILQELLHEVKPDLVVETGTFKGGSALFYATTLDAVSAEERCGRGTPVPIGGSVFTIDTEARENLPEHPRVSYLRGSSVAPETLALVARAVREAAAGGPVLVVLDSDHSYDHVLAELRAYAPLVTNGSYIVVEDTNTPGPAMAVEDFLRSPEGREFENDRSREKFGTTFNRGGWLRKGGGL